MTSTPEICPFYLGTRADASFAMFHPADEAEPSIGLVICPPFGFEEIAAHRGLRDWAVVAADAGFPALRIDFPGTGDAGGSPRDPERLEAWTRSTARAARWLRAETGCGRIAALGLGLGGLVAFRAAALDEGVDDLALWAVPRRGRALVREMKAFARMNADESAALAVETAAPEDGSLEAGGFVLTAETLAALGDLDLSSLDLDRPTDRRVLLLERDGIAPDKQLEGHLEHAGVAVDVVGGEGYATLTGTPQASRTPVAAIDATISWLAAAPSGASPAPRGDPPAAHGHVELEVGGVAVRERPFAVQQPFGALHGVLTEPVGGATENLRGLLLNAGAVRRIGPGRLWVEFARSWAARGVLTLRVDIEAIGDSDGSRDYTDDGALYVPEMVERSLAALDAYEAAAGRQERPHYLLGGLCSGAYWGFHAALRDQRVRSLLMLNPRALYWHEALEVTRDARKMTRMGRGLYWKRMLRGQVSAERIRSVLAWALRAPIELPRAARERRRGRRQVEDALDRLRDEGKRILMVFGEDEPLDEELRSEGLFDRLEDWPGVEIERLSGRDHILRPIPTQRRLHALVDRAIARELEAGRQPEDPAPPPGLRAT